MSAITWLASYPKSGNTWVRMFLSAYSTDSLDINRPALSTGDNHPYCWQNAAMKPITELTDGEKLLLRPAALLHLLEMKFQGANPFLVKTHWFNMVLEGCQTIPQMLTKRAVYVLRDPRDVAISFSRHFSSTVDEAIEAMGQERHAILDEKKLPSVTGTWSAHVESWTKSKPYPVGVMKYEEMLDDPVRRFTGMLEFLEMPLDEARIARAIAACSFDRLQAQESEKGFRERKGDAPFFHTGKAGGWQDKLSDKQVRRIERDHGEVMTAQGYELAYAEAA